MNLQFAVPSVPRPNMDIFRNARANFLRRQQESERADLERQAARTAPTEPPRAIAPELSPQREMQERSPGSNVLRRFTDMRRPAMLSFISRRSSRPSPQARPSSSNYDNDDDIESPKTPRFNIGMPNLPSTRLHLPNLARTWTAGSNGPPSRPGTAPHGRRRSRSRSQSPTRSERAAVPVTEPVPAVSTDHGRFRRAGSSSRRFDGLDPAEIRLARMAEDGRRRRHRDDRTSSYRTSSDWRSGERESERSHRHRRRHRGGRESRGGAERQTPRRFLFCFPWIRSRRVRTQILRCFVSGIFLTLLLAVYLALSITKNINNSEFTVLLILIILFVTIFFCHGLIRLCMLIVKPPTEESEHRQRLPEMYGPGGYAIPRRPIRVVLTRDEEAVGIESETSKIRPPAYGLWRESVRVDPNRIYWQRNDEAPESAGKDEPAVRPASESRLTAAPRPPSYASEDGVSYVVEAQPRSIAPTTDVPLAEHPSEAGRSGRPAEW